MVFRKHVLPGIVICERCEKELPRTEFLVDGALPCVCKSCLKEHEIADFIVSPITKLFGKLDAYDKRIIIQRIMKDRVLICRVRGSHLRGVANGY